MMDVNIAKASAKDFNYIKKHISLFELDDRDIQLNQFVVAKKNNMLIGFGRIRKHDGCDEFCSLGVAEKYRLKGIAKLLINKRIEIATQPIYLVTIIPHYFKQLGFTEVKEFPAEMLDKLTYCTSELQVPEKYVVMKYIEKID